MWYPPADFTTQLCPGSIGPAYGAVLRFDRASKSAAYFVPERTIDCWITLRGRPTEPDKPQRYVTLTWRPDWYSVRGHNFGTGAGNTALTGGACERAYVEVYRATSDGRHIVPPVVGPVCGVTSPVAYTTTSQTLVVHVFVAVPLPPTTTTAAPTPTTTTSNVTTTTIATTTAVTTTTTTTSPITTTIDPNVTTVTTPTPNSGPFVNFTADFTSFFVGKSTCLCANVLLHGTCSRLALT